MQPTDEATTAPVAAIPDSTLRALLDQEIRMREATLDVFGSLGFQSARDLSFGINDTSGVGGVSLQPPWYQQNRGLGEVIPVYRSEVELRAIRDRARILSYYNEFAICALENYQNYVVGDGFAYSATPVDPTNPAHRHSADEVQRVIDGFCQLNDITSLETDAVFDLHTDGEFFIHCTAVGPWLHTRGISPENVRQPIADGNDPANSFGVITDYDDVETVHGYWVVADPLTQTQPERYDASEVLHVKHNTRRNAKRGLPTFFPVEANLRRAEDLLASMTSVAKARAKIAMIRKVTGLSTPIADSLLAKLTEVKATDPATGQTLNVERLRYGTILTASANTEYQFPNVQLGASDIVEVLQAELRTIASRVQMPEWMLTALADAKYSNAFVVEAPTLKAFRRLQRKLRDGFGLGRYGHRASLIWRQLKHSVACGVLATDDLKNVALSCEGPTLEARDRAQEVTRHKDMVTAGFESKETAQRALELDPDVEAPQIAVESVGKARPVADMAAVQALQVAYTSGQISRPAAAANLMILMAFTREQAESLLPPDDVVKREGAKPPEPAPQPDPAGTPPGAPPPDATDTPPAGDPPPEGDAIDAMLAGAVTEQLAAAFAATLREQGFTGDITDAAGRKRRYEDGKQVATTHDAPADDVKAAADTAAPDGVPSGVWAKISDKVLTATAKVYGAMVRATPAALAVMDGVLNVLDTPADLAKFGYEPMGKSGTADALKGATGISTHMAAGILTKVMAKAYVAAKRKLSGPAKEATTDAVTEAAGILYEAIGHAAEALGLPAPDLDAITAALRGGAKLQEQVTHKFGCVLAVLPPDIADRIRELAASIPDADLADDGREDDPHVTVLYGLHGDDAGAVRGAITGGPISVRLGAASVFPGGDGKDYDVVKYDVTSPDLHRLNGELAKLPHTNKYPEYKPHATVAYVRKGLGDGYAAKFGAINADTTVGELRFSDRQKNQTAIQLNDNITEQEGPPDALDIVLQEAGFTGERKDSLGRVTNWADGKRVAKVKPAPKPREKKAPPPPVDKKAVKAETQKQAHDAVTAALADTAAPTPERLHALNEAMKRLTVPQLVALKKAHDAKGGRTKQEHIDKLIAAVKAKGATPPAPVAPSEPLPAKTKPAPKPRAKAAPKSPPAVTRSEPTPARVEAFPAPIVTADAEGNRTTTFAPGYVEAAAKKYGAAVAEMIDSAADMEDGYAPLSMVAGLVKREHPDATDNDIMAAAKWLNDHDVVEGHSMTDAHNLTKSGLGLNGGKDDATATLWNKGNALHYWMGHRSGDTRKAAAEALKKLGDV